MKFRTMLLTEAVASRDVLDDLARLRLRSGEFIRFLQNAVCGSARYAWERDGRVWVTIAYKNGKAVGVVYFKRDESTYRVGVFVEEAYRRLGIGKALVRYVRSKTRKSLYGSWWDKRSLSFFSAAGC